MSRTIMLIPTASYVGLTSVSLGLIRAMERKGIRLGVLSPIAQFQLSQQNDSQTTAILKTQSSITSVGNALPLHEAERLLGNNHQDLLMEEMVTYHRALSKTVDTVLIEGLIPTSDVPFAHSLNYELAKTLDAEIIFVVDQSDTETPEAFKEYLALFKSRFGGEQNDSVFSVIINKFNAPSKNHSITIPSLSDIIHSNAEQKKPLDAKNFIEYSSLPVLACVPWKKELMTIRAIDLATQLNAEILNAGEMQERRISHLSFCSRNIPNITDHLRAGSLLITSADRVDVLVAICLAAMNGVKVGGLLLTGGFELTPTVKALCQQAFNTGLPVFAIPDNTWETAMKLQNLNTALPVDDKERIELTQEYVAGFIDEKWISTLQTASPRSHRFSPPAFRYHLTELARQAKKCIVLPEGEEPRTITAAAICAERGIAECILLGDPQKVESIAVMQGIKLADSIKIVDPNTVREKYVARLVELRKSKGMTEIAAREQLTDNVVLGTMMLERNEVDGLVSGAIHTTANTIRPPLQIIKTDPNSSLVSSVFFMLLPDQVLVYGDCAINPTPNAEQLAEIAIQSADSAAAFGIDPKVAMISYSTGDSGTGSDVEKVREATRIAKEKRPDLLIDGPLQYDAAVMPDVAKSKAPNSPVAGHATVFIFPDLNTGNTTYKAVQRSANLVSIGPMLQGMRKPVNDLSRGALVDDIVYTIALTAIQSAQADSR